MFEWHVKYSEAKVEGSRISCDMGGVTVYADDETEARKIMEGEMPEVAIDAITRGEEITDDDA